MRGTHDPYEYWELYIQYSGFQENTISRIIEVTDDSNRVRQIAAYSKRTRDL